MNKIFFGDCRDSLRAMEPSSVQMCVTSPPYFGLRDYGHDGQIGLEATPEQFIAELVEVFREVRRVLADDGTLWVNIGDSYAAQRGGTHMPAQTVSGGVGGKGDERAFNGMGGEKRGAAHRNASAIGLKHKDLIGIPWMLAFALRADGWYLRSEIIWHKPNPMPESVTDRPTKSHENLFLLSKSPRYFYDSEAVKEPVKAESLERAKAGFKTSSRDDAVASVSIGANERTRFGLREKFNMPEKRNRRSVWTIATRPYKGAHFAVFPADLVEPCILAGTSENGHCPACGERWKRQVDRVSNSSPVEDRIGRQSHNGAPPQQSGNYWTPPKITDNGFAPTCKCGHDPVPDVVLDCFMGSATTAAVAIKHGRHYVGCELNIDYKPLQDERIANAHADLAAPKAKPKRAKTRPKEVAEPPPRHEKSDRQFDLFAVVASITHAAVGSIPAPPAPKTKPIKENA